MVRKINQARCCCVVPRDDYGPRTVLSNRTQVSLSCTHVVKWARIYLRHYYLERAGLLDLFLLFVVALLVVFFSESSL